MPASIVLASTSAGRRFQLERLGLDFRCEGSGVDERGAHSLGLDPIGLARHLARAKARAVAERHPLETIVIGGDQLVDFDGQILGKPGTAGAAVDQLAAMSGRVHRLITAVALSVGSEIHEHVNLTTMVMRGLSRAEIERYVAADDPVDCAGAYRIERRGIALFESIETEDFTSIVGLPLLWLTSRLRGLGIAVP
jgi:septum formation protein